MSLAQLKANGQLWHFSSQQQDADLISTGYAALDDLIGGWPSHEVVELFATTGSGELRLLQPWLQTSTTTLANLGCSDPNLQAAQFHRQLVFINPPAMLSAQALLLAGFHLPSIWQINCKGKYPYQPFKKDLNKKLIDTDKTLTFTGNGVATTNNKGEFHFITVYPPAVHGIESHINVRVEHRKLGNLQTRLFLKGHKLATPEYYPELSNIYEVASKKNISIYNYQIVISGESEDNY